mgnify:CR=1 FL=1
MNLYTGCIENRNDPLRLGRCQVRVVGLHTHDKTLLPTEDLPWAYPLQPINSAAMNGIGWSPTGPVPGTTVIILFADQDKQQPLMFGTVGGIPQSKSAAVAAAKAAADAAATAAAARSSALASAAATLDNVANSSGDAAAAAAAALSSLQEANRQSDSGAKAAADAQAKTLNKAKDSLRELTAKANAALAKYNAALAELKRATEIANAANAHAIEAAKAVDEAHRKIGKLAANAYIMATMGELTEQP